MLNIILPIAGRGSRFSEAGYKIPKPLITIHGVPMIEVVVNNVRPLIPHHFTFIALKEHLDHLNMRETLNRIAPGCSIVPVNHVTEGAACTVLLAKEIIDNQDPLMLVNSDQWVDIDINSYLDKIEGTIADGLIMTMTANHPKWSYVDIDVNGYVTRVVEKEVISEIATVGIYNFSHGSDFVHAAKKMIANDFRVNGEFYIAPVYNILIEEHAKICVYNVGKDRAGMYGLGIPTDLEAFVEMPLSYRASGINK